MPLRIIALDCTLSSMLHNLNCIWKHVPKVEIDKFCSKTCEYIKVFLKNNNSVTLKIYAETELWKKKKRLSGKGNISIVIHKLSQVANYTGVWLGVKMQFS